MNFRRVRWHGVLILLCVNAVLFYGVWSETRTGILRVSFLNVGQGDAIFIESPAGIQILIDGGSPNKKVLFELGALMPFYDRSIDVVVATHPDEDHIGGLSDVLERYAVGVVLDSGLPRDTASFRRFEEIIKEKNIPYIQGARGERIYLGNDTYADILYPDRDLLGVEPNIASIIIKLTYGENTFLFTGDAPVSVEEYISQLEKDNLDVDVLKIGHHGSKTSTSETLLGLASPEYAVISVGKDNSYGHPHPDVLLRLKKFEIPILRTDESGTIVFTTDG